MLKLAQFLHKYRAVVLIVLGLPILGIFFSSEFHLEMIPQNPHVQFNLEFAVPARPSSEIFQRVTKPTEKILNGLPGLLGLSSKTQNEKVLIQLIFQESITANSAYLNIQEKMDRIRLLLPRDVKSWKIERNKPEKAADLHIKFKESIPLAKLSHVMSPIIAGIQKTIPSLDQTTKIIVKPDPLKLAQNKLPLSQMVGALQSLGLETAIGRKDGVMFETGLAFKDIETLRGAPVAARGHRPIKLSDVAHVELQVPDPIREIKIWIDPQRVQSHEVKSLLTENLSLTWVRSPFWKAIFEQSLQPIALILMVFLMQFFVLKALKLPLKALPSFAIMGGVVCVHFLFWKGLILPPLTVLDLHSLAMTLMIGSILLAVLYARIRTFFYSKQRILRPNKTLDQAKLFSLAELIPTFVVLIIAFYLTVLPTLSTGTNLPSREIASSLFYLGLPILLLVLVVTPLSTATSFLKENVEKPKARMNWSLSPQKAQNAMWGLFIFIFSIFFLFDRMDVGISYSLPENELSSSMMQNLRGYGQSLVYKSPTTPSSPHLTPTNPMRDRLTKHIEFSPSSLQHLGSLDLSGFATSFEKVQSSSVFGFLHSRNKKIPIQFSSELLKLENFEELLLASKNNDTPAKPVRLLTQAKLQSDPSQIIRDNLVTGDHFIVNEEFNNGTFNSPVHKLSPTPWSQYLLNQFQEFKDLHLVSLIFLFFLFAIYLNSFIRSGMLMIFVIATVGFVYLFREVIPSAYHADSLWLLYIGPFMALFQILVLTRIIDIERSRGHDRDLCIEEAKEEFAPTVYICSWVLIIAIFIAGLTEYIPGIPTLGLWKEGVFISAFTAVILLVSSHILFPLFYLNSEEFVDRILFRIYKIVSRNK